MRKGGILSSFSLKSHTMRKELIFSLLNTRKKERRKHFGVFSRLKIEKRAIFWSFFLELGLKKKIKNDRRLYYI